MSWPTKKLGEICDINGGNAAPQDYSVFSEDGIPFVRMQDLGRYHITDNFTETRDRIKREAISKLRIKIFPKGSIILPRSGSVFANHRAILGIDAAVVSHIAILNNYRGVHPRYFFWYLTKLDIGRHAVKTSNVDSISFQRLGKFEIPLPPLEIQKQIVERLDKIVGAQKLNDGLIQKADELFQSLLYKELNPSGEKWEEKEIADIAEARSGFGFPLDLQGDKNGGLPFYKVSDMNIVGNEIEMKSHNNSISVAKGEKLKYKPAPAGSVIFPKIGAAVATNKKRILVRDSLYDNNVMALIPNKLIDPNFLYFWLRNIPCRLGALPPAGTPLPKVCL